MSDDLKSVGHVGNLLVDASLEHGAMLGPTLVIAHEVIATAGR